MKMFIDTKVIGTNIPNAQYIAQDPEIKRGDPRFVMSRSQLMDFARCPSAWMENVPDEGTKATDWGSLIDCLALSPEQYDKLYTVTPATYTNSKGESKEWDMRSNTCRDWVAEVKKSGITAIPFDQYTEALKAIAKLKKDKIATSFIDASVKQMLITSTYVDEVTGIKVPVKILLDLVPDKDHPEHGTFLGDFKTSRGVGHREWANYVAEHGYDVQAAFYTDIYLTAFHEDRRAWRHVIQENSPPYEVGRRVLSLEFLDIGRRKYRSALRDYCVCLATNTWPSYDDYGDTMNGWSLTQPKEWMADAAFGMGLQLPAKAQGKNEPDPDLIP